MNKIPKEILDRLPSFEPDKYDYSWGPVGKRPGLEMWLGIDNRWKAGAEGSESCLIYRWPKPRKRWEIILEDEHDVGDRYHAGEPQHWQKDFEKWPKVEKNDEFLPGHYVFIREIKGNE